MFPILVPLIGGLAIRSYGVLVAVALLVGAAITRRGVVSRGLSPRQADEVIIAAVIGGLIGARLYYVLFTDPAMLVQRPLEVLALWRGGLAVHGGWFGGVAAALRVLRRHRFSIWRFADGAAPALALGQAIGRVGCFLSGCCFGVPTAAPWGVTFHHPESLAPRGIPLHPTQLYESVADLAVFGVLVWYGRRPRCEGRIVLLYLMLSSVVRFVVEAWRWDSLYLWSTTLKMAQLVSGVLFLAALMGWAARRRNGTGRKTSDHRLQASD